MSKILVIGASGTVGSEIVKILKQKKQEVLRATAKTDLKPDQVHLDLLTGKGSEVLTQVETIFMLSPPGYVNQDELLIPLIDKAKNSGVKKIVLMTAMGVDANDQAPLRKVELHLQNSGLNYNIIRPNWFMQNFNSYWIHDINHSNKIKLPVEKAKGSFIDARDIASVGAELILTDKFNKQAFNLTGAEALDHDQVAEMISKVSNRQIKFENISSAEMFEGLLKAGLPKLYSEFMLVILEFFRLGYSAQVTNSIELITGKKPIRFAKYVEDYKDSWIK